MTLIAPQSMENFLAALKQLQINYKQLHQSLV
jgi:hypothetical protein